MAPKWVPERFGAPRAKKYKKVSRKNGLSDPPGSVLGPPGVPLERLGRPSGPSSGPSGALPRRPRATRNRIWTLQSRLGRHFERRGLSNTKIDRFLSNFHLLWEAANLDLRAQAQCFVRFSAFAATHDAIHRNDPPNDRFGHQNRPKSIPRGRLGSLRATRSVAQFKGASNHLGRPSRAIQVASADSGRPTQSNQARSAPPRAPKLRAHTRMLLLQFGD